jgi:hypothetical protein
MSAIARPCRQRGVSTIEYVCACAALAVALFVPIQDAASPDQPRTALGIVLDAMARAYQNFSYAISLPS